MNRDRVISLADVPPCPAAVTAFYDRYRARIEGIETTIQRNDILSAMQQDFERNVRHNPQERNELSRVYELLKMKCWEV